MSYHIFLLEFLCLEQWLCGHVRVVINIGDFNIGEFSEKSPIANSSLIKLIVLYGMMHEYRIGFYSDFNVAAAVSVSLKKEVEIM